MNTAKSYKIYIISIFSGAVFFFFCLVLFIFIFENKLPAPRLSSSESFNEKARWIRNNLSNGCDILIIGSSMALNNIDANLVKSAFPGKSVVNTGSWGLNILESSKILHYIGPICHPKVIIFPVFFLDFDNQWEKNIDWDLFVEYISSKSTIFSYIKSLDVRYYISTYISRKITDKKLNRVYQSLFFDKTGSVMFDSDDFEVDILRWNGYNNYKLLNEENARESLSSLSDVVQTSKQLNSKLILIKTPMRFAANNALAKPEITVLWTKVSRSINDSGDIFFNINSAIDFPDNFFSDYAHLNRDGANRVAKYIIPVLDDFFKE